MGNLLILSLLLDADTFLQFLYGAMLSATPSGHLGIVGDVQDISVWASRPLVCILEIRGHLCRPFTGITERNVAFVYLS